MPTTISYLKGIEKIQEKRSAFQNALSLEQSQGNPGEERDGRASGRLQVSQLSSKTFKICRINSILHCSKLKICKKMWQSINGLIYQRIPKGLKVLPAKLRKCGALG